MPKQNTQSGSKRKPQSSQLEAALAALDAARALVIAQIETAETQPEHDELLSTKESLERYGLGHDGVRAAAERGELAVQRGARGKLLVLDSELRRYIASRPYSPGPRRAPAADLDAWEAQADRALKIVGAK